MRAWRFHRHGDLDNLSLEDVPVPRPRETEGEALVRLEFAALNPADAFVVRGLYPRAGNPPLIVGRDGSGVVEAPAAGRRFRKGERVIILRSEIGVTRDGTLAEYVAAPEAALAPLPEGWSAQEGAAGPLVFLTAHQALIGVGELRAGQTVFVNGASGGVGTATVMLGRALGARVVGASRSESKRKRLLELGADVVVDSSDPDIMEEQVKAALGDGRVDLVVENLGGPYLQAAVNLLKEGGRIGVVGLLAGLSSEITLGRLMFKRARIEGVAVGALTTERAQAAWREIVAALARTGARPMIDQVFPMANAKEAFARLAEGPMGKVLIDVRA